MKEIIAYFEQLEARIAALEAEKHAPAPAFDDTELRQKIDALTEQLSAQLTTISALQEQLASYQESNAELESRMDELESRAEFDLPEDDSFDEDEIESETETEEEPDQDEQDYSLPITEPEPESESEPEIAQPEPEPEPEPVPHTVVPKVSDIKKAISLGDRFLFQRELFGGNGEKMAKTIAELNRLSGLDEAEAYIDKHFSWDKQSSTYELFYNILKRRW